MTPYPSYRPYRTADRRAERRRAPGRRRGGRMPASALVLVSLLAVAVLGVLALVAVLPAMGVRVPGARRVVAYVNELPLPWKAPRPEYVPAPPPAVAPLQASSQAPAQATSQTQGLPQAPAQATAPAQPTPQPTPPPAGAVPAPPAGAQAAPAGRGAVASRVAPAPASVRLSNFRHQWQTWNNCGPATITMATSHFGRGELQAQAATFLKPNADDKNVGPDELVAFARSTGLQADYRVGGDLERLKLLLANGVPVVAEMWFTPRPNDGMGHYRLLVGYDDVPGRFIAYDSYDQPGVNVPLPYGPFDADWRVFNRTYIPVYTAAEAPIVAEILGPDADDGAMWERTLGIAQQEAAANGSDPFAWFNVGTALQAMGRTGEAVEAFDRARSLRLPWRMLWYQFAPLETYLVAGRLNDVLTLTGANLQQDTNLEESHYYRGRALHAQGQGVAARSAFQAALRANPRYAPAHHAIATLQ